MKKKKEKGIAEKNKSERKGKKVKEMVGIYEGAIPMDWRRHQHGAVSPSQILVARTAATYQVSTVQRRDEKLTSTRAKSDHRQMYCRPIALG